MCVCVWGRVSPHFQSIELPCCCMLVPALVLAQQNRMLGGKEGGNRGKQKRGGREGGGPLGGRLFVTVNRLRVVHIIWPLMAAPPLL